MGIPGLNEKQPERKVSNQLLHIDTLLLLSQYDFDQHFQAFSIGLSSVSDSHILQGAELKKSINHRDILITSF